MGGRHTKGSLGVQTKEIKTNMMYNITATRTVHNVNQYLTQRGKFGD